MRTRDYCVPQSVTGNDIRVMRKRSGMTQREFARWCAVSVKTVERWEEGKEDVKGPVVTLLTIMADHPGINERYLIQKPEFGMRLLYYYRSFLCTVIDVDERTRKVRIQNFVQDAQMRAFGTVDQPTFEQYQDFLVNRCFAPTADKMKIRLRELDVPFYDPILIIEKTQGRMAEDDFWIRIERTQG